MILQLHQRDAPSLNALDTRKQKKLLVRILTPEIYKRESIIEMKSVV